MKDSTNLLSKMFIPKEAVLNEYVMYVRGNDNIFIEGLESIRELSDKIIILKVKKGIISITGNNLYVDYFSELDIAIRGTITSISLA